MMKHLTKNWVVKLVCLVLASIFWIYVSISQNMVTKLPGSIKIKAINISDSYAASFDQKTVEISVKAKSSVWQTLTADSFTASVDLAGLPSGTHELSVNVFTMLPDVQVVSKTPSRITVSIEPVVSKDFTISPKLVGETASGMVVGGVSFATNTVRVKGAKSAIESVVEVGATINLAGESGNFSKDATLGAYDSDGKVVSGLTFDLTKVLAEVTVVRGSNIKTVGIKPKITGALKSGYFISGITTSPEIVDISGVKDVISSTKYLETLVIDVSGVADNIDRETNIQLPNGVALQGGVSTKVSVSITVDFIQGNREVKVLSSSFMPKNLGSYSVESYSVPEVALTVKGQTDSVVAASAYGITFDFAGKTLRTGDFTFEVNQDNISLPQGVTLVSFLPKSVTVRLRNN
ncbi:MAG: CdaR family protein [Patescibacteria group bacterium]|jgi:YbbR domain-containing protein